MKCMIRNFKAQNTLRNHASQKFSNSDSRNRIHLYYAENSSVIVGLRNLLDLKARHTKGNVLYYLASGSDGPKERKNKTLVTTCASVYI